VQVGAFVFWGLVFGLLVGWLVGWLVGGLLLFAVSCFLCDEERQAREARLNETDKAAPADGRRRDADDHVTRVGH
jgi:vacuolar-type H+-ATPase subunit I/STV1